MYYLLSKVCYSIHLRGYLKRFTFFCAHRISRWDNGWIHKDFGGYVISLTLVSSDLCVMQTSEVTVKALDDELVYLWFRMSYFDIKHYLWAVA